MAKYIDSFNYPVKNEEDSKKRIFYLNAIETVEEHDKTKKLKNKLDSFVSSISGIYGLEYFDTCPESKIHYVSGVGYITDAGPIKGRVYIYHYGDTIDDAFLMAINDYLLPMCEEREWKEREKLRKEYNDRFQDNNYKRALFIAEFALNEFKKFYKKKIPEDIVEYYETYLRENKAGDFKYDYETKSFIKDKEKSKILKK